MQGRVYRFGACGGNTGTPLPPLEIMRHASGGLVFSVRGKRGTAAMLLPKDEIEALWRRLGGEIAVGAPK